LKVEVLERCERCGLTIDLRDVEFYPMCGGRLLSVIPKIDVEKGDFSCVDDFNARRRKNRSVELDLVDDVLRLV